MTFLNSKEGKMYKSLISLAIIGTFLLSTQNSYSQVVATVNGDKINKDEFEQAYQQNKLFVSDRIVTKEKIINDLINRSLGIQKAKSEKLQDDPTVKSKIEDILFHAQVSKDLEPELKKITVSDSEVKNYYKSNPEYRSAHILIRVRADASEKEAIDQMKVAKEIRAEVEKDPSKFAEIANRYSQSTLAANGGDMGFQPAVRVPPEYYNSIKGKNKGYITPIVRTQFGYHIIKVIAERDFKDIEPKLYKKIIYDIKRDKVLDSYFAKLRKGAAINIEQKYIK